MSEPVQDLSVGCVAEITGIASRLEWNGQLAHVTGWVEDAGRWIVTVIETREEARLRPECLLLRIAPGSQVQLEQQEAVAEKFDPVSRLWIVRRDLNSKQCELVRCKSELLIQTTREANFRKKELEAKMREAKMLEELEKASTLAKQTGLENIADPADVMQHLTRGKGNRETGGDINSRYEQSREASSPSPPSTESARFEKAVIKPWPREQLLRKPGRKPKAAAKAKGPRAVRPREEDEDEETPSSPRSFAPKSRACSSGVKRACLAAVQVQRAKKSEAETKDAKWGWEIVGKFVEVSYPEELKKPTDGSWTVRITGPNQKKIRLTGTAVVAPTGCYFDFDGQEKRCPFRIDGDGSQGWPCRIDNYTLVDAQQGVRVWRAANGSQSTWTKQVKRREVATDEPRSDGSWRYEIVGFIENHGTHFATSDGFRMVDGQPMTDILNIESLISAGRLSFLDESRLHRQPLALPRPPSSRPKVKVQTFALPRIPASKRAAIEAVFLERFRGLGMSKEAVKRLFAGAALRLLCTWAEVDGPVAAVIHELRNDQRYNNEQTCAVMHFIASTLSGAASQLVEAAGKYLAKKGARKLYSAADIESWGAVAAHHRWGFKFITRKEWIGAALPRYTHEKTVSFMALDLR